MPIALGFCRGAFVVASAEARRRGLHFPGSPGPGPCKHPRGGEPPLQYHAVEDRRLEAPYAFQRQTVARRW